MNPRFLAYCKAHGRTAKQQLKQDRIDWPGGVMCGFILWIAKKREEFYKVNRNAFLDRWTICDQEAWTKFLQHGHN